MCTYSYNKPEKPGNRDKRGREKGVTFFLFNIICRKTNE